MQVLFRMGNTSGDQGNPSYIVGFRAIRQTTTYLGVLVSFHYQGDHLSSVGGCSEVQVAEIMLS